MEETQNIINTIINGDCIEEMNKLPESYVDLIVTSPPYNVGIDYDTHDDRMDMHEYWQFTKDWLTAAFNTLKDDGRIAVNIHFIRNIHRNSSVIF